MKTILILISLLLFSRSVIAFKSELTFKGKVLKLSGADLLEYGIFSIDIYKIAYYTHRNTKILVLDYQRDIAQKYSIEGWKLGFENNSKVSSNYKEQINWIYKSTPNIKKGDKLYLVKSKKTASILHNNQLVATSTDPKVLELIHIPWIGANPVSKEIKENLLKGI